MKKDIGKAYLTILWFALLPAVLIAFDTVSGCIEGQRMVKVPLPAFEELEVVEGNFNNFRKKYSRFAYDEFTISLSDGNKYYLSRALYNILHQTAFETNMREGKEITLWVTELEEASLNGKTPTIFQIVMDDRIYLSYRDAYRETMRIRTARTDPLLPLLIPAECYFIGFFLYNRIRYEKTGKIPRWARKELKKLGFSEEDEVRSFEK